MSEVFDTKIEEQEEDFSELLFLSGKMRELQAINYDSIEGRKQATESLLVWAREAEEKGFRLLAKDLWQLSLNSFYSNLPLHGNIVEFRVLLFSILSQAVADESVLERATKIAISKSLEEKDVMLFSPLARLQLYNKIYERGLFSLLNKKTRQILTKDIEEIHSSLSENSKLSDGSYRRRKRGFESEREETTLALLKKMENALQSGSETINPSRLISNQDGGLEKNDLDVSLWEKLYLKESPLLCWILRPQLEQAKKDSGFSEVLENFFTDSVVKKSFSKANRQTREVALIWLLLSKKSSSFLHGLLSEQKEKMSRFLRSELFDNLPRFISSLWHQAPYWSLSIAISATVKATDEHISRKARDFFANSEELSQAEEEITLSSLEKAREGVQMQEISDVASSLQLGKYIRNCWNYEPGGGFKKRAGLPVGGYWLLAQYSLDRATNLYLISYFKPDGEMLHGIDITPVNLAVCVLNRALLREKGSDDKQMKEVLILEDMDFVPEFSEYVSRAGGGREIDKEKIFQEVTRQLKEKFPQTPLYSVIRYEGQKKQFASTYSTVRFEIIDYSNSPRKESLDSLSREYSLEDVPLHIYDAVYDAGNRQYLTLAEL